MRSWLNRIFCFFLLFAPLACSGKNDAAKNRPGPEAAPLEPKPAPMDDHVNKTISIESILQSTAWNIEQNKIDESTKKFDENQLTEPEKDSIRELYQTV